MQDGGQGAHVVEHDVGMEAVEARAIEIVHVNLEKENNKWISLRNNYRNITQSMEH